MAEAQAYLPGLTHCLPQNVCPEPSGLQAAGKKQYEDKTAPMTFTGPHKRPVTTVAASKATHEDWDYLKGGVGSEGQTGTWSLEQGTDTTRVSLAVALSVVCPFAATGRPCCRGRGDEAFPFRACCD